MTNDLLRNARAAIAARAKTAKRAAAPVSRALARKRADAYAAFIVATAKAETAARRKGG
jgi:hypothetical protein